MPAASSARRTRTRSARPTSHWRPGFTFANSRTITAESPRSSTPVTVGGFNSRGPNSSSRVNSAPTSRSTASARSTSTS